MNYLKKDEFMKLAGINNRQRLHQLLKGFTTGKYHYPPVLKKGEDYDDLGMIFYPSALQKIKKSHQS